MSIPEKFYRNQIDINRYENDLAARLIETYNKIMVDAAQRLQKIPIGDGLDKARAVRLKSILKQVKADLDKWRNSSLGIMVKELKDVADVQKDFIEGLLEDIAPPELAGQINALQIDPDFVDSLIKYDPTKSNQIGLPKGKVFDVFKDTTSMQALQTRFALTAGVGKEIVLPNGDVVAKAFRGLTEKTADRFAHTVRQGLLEGRSLQTIQRQLIGTLDFNPRSKGGIVTTLSNAQTKTLVKTTVHQLNSEISRKSYQINPNIVKRWEYSAIHDQKTSAICRALDGKRYKVGEGPYPPQHFNCRSVDVPIPVGPITGKEFVPDGETYGQWFEKKVNTLNKEESGKGTAYGEKVLGVKGFAVFKGLRKKYKSPTEAMRKFIKKDGSRKSLDELTKLYKKK
jgi:SPP1 gp7 family putative phage head morphogenesis protein